nr:MAG TPA: YopX protein [Caudoviricetes sp.]
MNDRDLYKAKRIDNKEWITGNYMFPDQIYDYINKIAYRIEPKTLCRCTGLKDRKGELIWEGDIIVQKQGYKAVVKYGRFNYSWIDGIYGWYFNGGDVREHQGYEVIGNIFDHPELMEGEEWHVAEKTEEK